MALWGDSCLFGSVEENEVHSLYLGVRSVLHWCDKCGVAVNFHHDHDVLLSSLRMEGEATSLV